MNNSVSWINEQVQTIVSKGRDFMGRINVQQACEDLLANNSILQDYFERDDYDPDELYKKEEVVAVNYIRLEYILCTLVPDCMYSYVKRNRVKTSYEKLMLIAKDNGNSTETRLEALNLSKIVANAYCNLTTIDMGVKEEELCRCEEFINTCEGSNV